MINQIMMGSEGQMYERWAASNFFYWFIFFAGWRILDTKCGGRCKFDQLSPYCRALWMVVVCAICMLDAVHYYEEFGFLDPESFHQHYTNGTLLGQEWLEEQHLSWWLQWPVACSPIAPLSVTLLCLYSLYISYFRPLSGAGLASPRRCSQPTNGELLGLPDRFIEFMLSLSGHSQFEKAQMVRIMPAIYVFMSFNSIMRILQLITGEINYANLKHEASSLPEKMEFCIFMVSGNSNCMALFSAWTLLKFVAYLLQGLQTVAGEEFENTQLILKTNLFQMLKIYILATVVQSV